MGTAWGVVLGAAISIAVSFSSEWLRTRLQSRISERQRTRDAVQLYLPEILKLFVAAKWKCFDIDEQLGDTGGFDNPYPADSPALSHWYDTLVYLGHHTAFSSDVHELAQDLAEKIEYMNLGVIDGLPEAGEELRKLLAQVERLISSLEKAASRD